MAWDIIYFRREDGSVPSRDFLANCPKKVRARILAVLEAVAEAPPPQFAGGGRWEAMKKEMSGFYEIRISGPAREQFRLFCILENADGDELGRRGLSKPAIAVITGMRKPWKTSFDTGEYASVRRLGDQHRSIYPRRIAT